jgi:hypothetical protein
LLGKYSYTAPTESPAASAMLVVVTRSKPSDSKSRAADVSNAEIDRSARFCEGRRRCDSRFGILVDTVDGLVCI